jgi:hypothetical protein
MSEYQYYEFMSIDKPLTKKQQDEINSLSSRTRANASGAIFTYSYGDFRYDELEIVEKYFDAMFYIANWGSKRVIFKFPKDVINIEEIQKYCSCEEITLSKKKNFVLLDIDFSEDEPDEGWIEGEGVLSSIINLREDIINGDYRCLYLAWLHTLPYEISYVDDEIRENDKEPDVPPNLKKLNNALENFVEILGIDQDILTAASENSKNQEKEKNFNIEKLIKSLSEEEKNSFLIRLSNNEALLSQKFLKKLKEMEKTDIAQLQHVKHRTLSELLSKADSIRIKREENERIKKEKAILERFENLEKNEKLLWKQVHDLVSEKKIKPYDQAILILKDLKELANHKNQSLQFKIQIKNLIEKYSKLPGFKSRLYYSGLSTEKR